MHLLLIALITISNHFLLQEMQCQMQMQIFYWCQYVCLLNYRYFFLFFPWRKINEDLYELSHSKFQGCRNIVQKSHTYAITEQKSILRYTNQHVIQDKSSVWIQTISLQFNFGSVYFRNLTTGHKCLQCGTLID